MLLIPVRIDELGDKDSVERVWLRTETTSIYERMVSRRADTGCRQQKHSKTAIGIK